MELIDRKQRIEFGIRLGESHYREFKSAFQGAPTNKKKRPVAHICREIGEALVAFANADGGELFIGVEDNGEITGIPHTEDEVNLMRNAPRTHIHQHSKLPSWVVDTVWFYEKPVLYFSILKSIDSILQLPDGRCVRRKEKETLPAVFEQLNLERKEVLSKEYDGSMAEGCEVSDLDMGLLASVAHSRSAAMSPERYLQHANLGEFGLNRFRLRKATPLLFASDIRRWHQGCRLRILQVDGLELKTGNDYNVVREVPIIEGNIFKLIEDGWKAFESMLSAYTDYSSGKFETINKYPEEACRELLINAIAHRDYTSSNPIEIFFFEDRLEVKNPGKLLSTISIDDLKNQEGVHESRNTNIARVLRENEYMRELGEGIKRVFNLASEKETKPPLFKTNGASFTAVLYRISVYSREDKEYLSQFMMPLTNYQKQILILGKRGELISQGKILSIVGNKFDEYQKTISPLIKKKIIMSKLSNTQAKDRSKELGIPAKELPRFYVNSEYIR